MLIEGGDDRSRARIPADTVNLTAAVSLLAGIIHAVASVEHFEEALLFGLFFVVVAGFQFAWATAVYRSGGRAWLRTGAAVNLGVIAVWVLSRTTGLPVGPERWSPESVGVLDVVAGADEALIAILALAVLPAARRPGRLGSVAVLLAGALCVLSLAAVTVAGGHHH